MMIFTSIYGIVDGVFVSNFSGDRAFAAVNLVMPALMLPGAFGFMIGSGGMALVARKLGEGRNEEAQKVFSMLIYIQMIAGIVFTVIGEIFFDDITMLLGADEQMAPYCIAYGRAVLPGLTAFMLQNSLQGFMITAGRPGMGFLISVTAGVTNMVLDLVFVFFFRRGVTGAAAATVTSQCTGAVIPLFYFIFSRKSPIRLCRTAIKAGPVLRACANGSSEMVSNLSMSAVNILYNMQLMKYAGSDGVAAYGVIMYVSFIFVGIFFGYAIGSTPVISFHFGAGNKEELSSLLHKSLILVGCSAAVLTAAAELSAPMLAGIFVSQKKELMEMTEIAIRLFSLSFLFSWFNILGSAFFTALNNGIISAVISFLRMFAFQTAMIMLLPVFWELYGLWISGTAAELLSLAVTAVLLVTNRKKYGYAFKLSKKAR